MKRALVTGAGGFIGSHLVKRLKDEGYWVRGVDLKYPEFSETAADDFLVRDLRSSKSCLEAVSLGGQFDEVYQLAADMGGAGFVFTGKHDFEIVHNSSKININFSELNPYFGKLFFSSSACVYPQQIQRDPDNPGLKETDAYPANPDSDYGWEKLSSERLYLAMSRNKGVPVKIARFHNIYGPEGTWRGGREKAPAAACRKIAEARAKHDRNHGVAIWGDGQQTRSFLYIDECLEGVRRFMNSDFSGPVNIGSDEMISITNLHEMVASIAKYRPTFHYTQGPLGVRGRNSDNTLIKEKLGWAPNYALRKGMEQTYTWIEQQVLSSQ